MNTEDIKTPRTDAVFATVGPRLDPACMAYFSLCRELERENEAKRVVLESIRDTAIAMHDAVRTYPTRRTVICVEGPRRIKESANRVLYPSTSA